MNENESLVVERLTREAAEPVFKNERYIVTTDKDGKPVQINVEPLQENPVRVAQMYEALSVAGFIGYVNEHKLPESVIFYDLAQQSFNAQIDYHWRTDGEEYGRESASRRTHVANFKLPHTMQLDTWLQKNRKSMDPQEFAEFLIANADDLVSPGAQDMQRLALSFRAKKEVEFESEKNLDNGATTLVYKETIRGQTSGGTTDVPATFRIGIPVFRGFVDNEKKVILHAIEARLRYRVNEGRLTFWYDVPDFQRILERIADEIRIAIETETGLKMFEGRITKQIGD